MFVMFCNKIMLGIGIKFFKQKLLPDLLKHGQEVLSDEKANYGDRIVPHPDAQLYFLKTSVQLINEHCCFQDDDLAFQLMSMVESFKSIETILAPQCEIGDRDSSYEKLKKNRLKQKCSEIADMAFSVDDHISYNIMQNLSSAKKKNLQRIEMLKL